MNEFTTTRTNPLIDPHMHIWHAEIPLYLFLGGLVAGVMVLTGLWMLLRRGEERSTALSLIPWSGPVLLSVGMFFLWLDLEHPFNAWRFYMVWKPSSPMSWGSWILMGVYPASLLLAWAMTPENLRNRVLEGLGRIPGGDWLNEKALRPLTAWTGEHLQGVATANVVLGTALGVYTGVLLGTMAARPLWNSAILGPLFLTSGLSTGAAFMLLARLKSDERVLLGRLDMGLIAMEMLLLGLWMAGLASGGAASQAALHTIMGGPYTTAFWTLVVALGLVTPLVGEWVEYRHHAIPGRFAAGLVLVGGFALRWILVYAGQFSGLGVETALLH